MAIKPKTIAIRISGTTIKNNTPIYILNRNTGDRWTTYTLDEGDGVIALCDLRNNTDAGNIAIAWANGHVIEIQIVGNGYGYGILTLGNKQDEDIDISVTADSGPAVSI